MSKQAHTDALARLLMCSHESAAQFSNEVNWLLLQRAHQPATLETICAAISRLDRITVSSHQVADFIAGPAHAGTAETGEMPVCEAAYDVGEKNVLDAGVECPTSKEIDGSIIDGEIEDKIDVEIDLKMDIESGIGGPPPEDGSGTPSSTPAINSSRHDIYKWLTVSNPDKVTYAQIEQAMAESGLDPAIHEDDYIWIIERLEQQDILVVDALDVGVAAEADLAAALQENRTEIDRILRRIFGHSPNGGSELLTAEEQLRLLEIVQQGKQAAQQLKDDIPEEIEVELHLLVMRGQQAFDQLLLHNQRLVTHVALQCAKQARFLEVEDLVQEGTFGLARAIDRFDFGAGTRLSTYAVWWIRQTITRAIADSDRMIRLPVHRLDSLNAYQKAVAHLEKNTNRAPSDLEIASAMKLLPPAAAEAAERALTNGDALPDQLQQQVHSAVKHVQYLRALADAHMVSLDQPVGADEENSTLGDFLPDKTSPSPEQAAMTSSLREQLSSLLDGLSAREKAVLTYRFGLEDGGTETLEEVGRRYDLTRERIRQIEAKALRKLRHPMRSRHLRDYIDFTPKPSEEEIKNSTDSA